MGSADPRSRLLALVSPPRCGGCGDALLPPTSSSMITAWCGHCRDRWGVVPGWWPTVVGEAPGWAAAVYRGPIRRAVLAAKRGAPTAGEQLLRAQLRLALLPEGPAALLGHNAPATDMKARSGESSVEVTWVPAHPRRAIRGPDAGRVFASVVAGELDAPLRPLLGRSPFARRQAGLPDGERRRDPERLGLRVRAQPRRVVVLVDDVRTTGTTLNHAAALLVAAGARHVTAVVLATAPASLRLDR